MFRLLIFTKQTVIRIAWGSVSHFIQFQLGWLTFRYCLQHFVCGNRSAAERIDNQHEAPLTQDTKSIRLYTKLFFSLRVDFVGGLCWLRYETGTLPKTSCSLRHKPCSFCVCAEILWLVKNFQGLNMKFYLDVSRVNFTLTSCTLRRILVDYWLTSSYFVLTSYPNFKHEASTKYHIVMRSQHVVNQ